jgi:NAD(P)-dependent dehydrogenase (short-subunit alcohol dehydrogenase family)
MAKLTKRVCLLTGASGALGSAFIQRHHLDYRIIAMCHRSAVQFPTQLQTMVDPLDPLAELRENLNPVTEIRADISCKNDVDEAVAWIKAEVGDIDLVINAAAFRRWPTLLSDEALAVDEKMLSVNLLGPLRVVSAVAKTMWQTALKENQRRNRNVVNISSSAGVYVYPDLGQGLYAATKAGLNQLTYHLASELWDIGIRVNAVAPDSFPGRVSTETVVEAIRTFDTSATTGRIQLIVPKASL